MTRLNRIFMSAGLAILLLAAGSIPNAMAASAGAQVGGGSALDDQVRRELNKLPFISVFDHIDYEVPATRSA